MGPCRCKYRGAGAVAGFFCLAGTLRLAAAGEETGAADATAALSALQPSLGETELLMSAVVKVGGALIVVVALLVMVLYLLRRAGMGGGERGSGSLVSVLDSKMIAPKKYIAVVRVVEEVVVLGITEGSITFLTKLAGGEKIEALLEPSSAPAAVGVPFAAVFNKVLGKNRAAD